MDWSQHIEYITQQISTRAVQNNPIKESYPSLEEFMKAIELMTPQKEYHLSDHIFFVYFEALKQGSGEIYDNIIKCYQFRFNFGHSILTRNVLKKMINFINGSKVLEVGAGSCYHGHALRLSGVDIIMTDIENNTYPGRHNIHRSPWEKLVYLNACDAIKKFSDRTTLLLIWPPPHDQMAINSLNAFKGTQFIYIGETNIEVNGTNEFFATLKSQWKLEESTDLPHFIGVYDRVYFYKRK